MLNKYVKKLLLNCSCESCLTQTNPSGHWDSERSSFVLYYNIKVFEKNNKSLHSKNDSEKRLFVYCSYQIL